MSPSAVNRTTPADPPLPSGGLASISVVIGLAASVVGLLVASPLLALGPWWVVAVTLHQRDTVRARRLRRGAVEELPHYVDALIQGLKTGRSLNQVLASTAAPREVEARLAPIRVGLVAGLGLGPALARARAGRGLTADAVPSIDLLLTTLSVLVQRGGPAVSTLERLNDTVRSALWIDAEARVQAGQATASALLLAALPMVFAAGLMALDDRMAAFYTTRWLGAGCLLIAGSLSYVGWWWMGRLTEGRQ